jgi:hypothetical protein
MIEGAGFHSIKIMSENCYPIETMVNDPKAKSIMADLELTDDEIKGMARSVTSIKLYAEK